MLKLFTLAAILSVNLFCVSADTPKLTRSASGTFYLGGIARTAHDVALRAATPLKVELSGFVPEIDLDGTKHKITAAEYMVIKQTQDFVLLAAQRQVLINELTTKRCSILAAKLTEVTNNLNTLGKELQAKEALAKQELAAKQNAKIRAAKAALKSLGEDTSDNKCSIQ